MEMTEVGWEGAEACGACGLSCAHLSSCFTCHLRDEGSDSCDVLWWGPVWSVKNRTDSNVTSWTSLLGCWPLPQTLDSLQPPKQWQALIQLACQCGCYLWGLAFPSYPIDTLSPPVSLCPTRNAHLTSGWTHDLMYLFILQTPTKSPTHLVNLVPSCSEQPGERKCHSGVGVRKGLHFLRPSFYTFAHTPRGGKRPYGFL